MKFIARQCNSIRTLWKLFEPGRGLYLGRKNPNGPMRWVRRFLAVRMSKKSITDRYPEAEIEWQGWLN